MNRSIKFKLKNGKIVTIRRLKATDYDAMMLFYERFSKGQGAKWTWMFPGRYKNRTKESMTRSWVDTDNLYIEVITNKIINENKSLYINFFSGKFLQILQEFARKILKKEVKVL